MKTSSSPKAISVKTGQLHPRNPHKGRYDIEALCNTLPALNGFIRTNPAGQKTIDFSCEQAVLHLNKALLAHHYQIQNWQIPKGYLCPPIPGRADMIHYLADLLAESNGGEIPIGRNVRCLDIGTGANCIYPIIGHRSYGWQFLASDIDPVSVKTAQLIAQGNPGLEKSIRIVQQKNPDVIFQGIIKPTDRFALTLCNPPFHSSLEEAQAGSLRKWNNLHGGKSKSSKTLKDKRNFGGQKAELWCEGGEIAFLKRMVKESVGFKEQVSWFTTLVSKKDNLPALKLALRKQKVEQARVIKMSQGQKISHLLAWRF